MKRILFLVLFFAYSYMSYAQIPIENYIGTWKCEKGDTVFTVKLVKGKMIYKGKLWGTNLFGGYSEAVQGRIIDNYMNDINTQWIVNDASQGAPHRIYISAGYDPYNSKILSFVFFDQRKKHFNGKGIVGGAIELIGSNKLHWTLNEKEGIWWETEGNEDGVEVKPIGFSVPTDVILTKVEK